MEESSIIYESIDDWSDQLQVKKNGNNTALLFYGSVPNCVLSKYEVMELVDKLNLWLAEQE